MTTERTEYLCPVCGRIRAVENVVTRDGRQPRHRRIRCTGPCGGQKTDHTAVSRPDFINPATW